MGETKLCECCGEAEVSAIGLEHGYDYCDACCRCNTCDNEGCQHTCDEHYLWEKADCEECQAEHARWTWTDETDEAIRQAAEAHDWSIDNVQLAQTNSRYYNLSRPGDEDLKIRVSDHGDCYCTSDYSVVLPGRESGDDVPLQTVLDRLARLAQPANEED